MLVLWFFYNVSYVMPLTFTSFTLYEIERARVQPRYISFQDMILGGFNLGVL